MGVGGTDLEKLRLAGLMHDLGKIEIKEEILRKEGSLTAEEYHDIQTHAKGTFKLLSKFKFKHDLSDVPQIAASHHERWDGNGYPRGLKGEEIPFLARILAVADVLDAITSKRHYRNAMTISNALSIVKRESNGHFDPACADALFRLSAGAFIKIHMAEHLELLDPADLVTLGPVSLGTIFEICERETPTPEETVMLQRFYNYYQGPVPDRLEGKIKPAPKLESENTAPNC
jgi:HD-GYP domain-containing protein (c-di-GMP phosphodiesterase class II)